MKKSKHYKIAMRFSKFRMNLDHGIDHKNIQSDDWVRLAHGEPLLSYIEQIIPKNSSDANALRSLECVKKSRVENNALNKLILEDESVARAQDYIIGLSRKEMGLPECSYSKNTDDSFKRLHKLAKSAVEFN